jgi:hypothetical protein
MGLLGRQADYFIDSFQEGWMVGCKPTVEMPPKINGNLHGRISFGIGNHIDGIIGGRMAHFPDLVKQRDRIRAD